jgi:hypothetical protein
MASVGAVGLFVGVIVVILPWSILYIVARTIMDKLFVNKVYSKFTKKERQYYWGFLFFTPVVTAVPLVVAIYLFGFAVIISFSIIGIISGLFFVDSIPSLLRVEMDKFNRER